MSVADARPVPAEPGSAVSPSEDDRLVLDSVDLYLERGRELKKWWDQSQGGGPTARRFPLGRTFNRPDVSFGFFGEAPIGGRALPVMGNFQESFYDQPKTAMAGEAAAARWMRDQLREFVLHYFLRISSFRQPEGVTDTGGGAVPLLLQPLSWCSQQGGERQGFGFSQLFFKRAGGEIGTFPDAERFAIVDLRQIGPVYEWIVAKVRIFDFNVTYQPLGRNSPSFVLPLEEASYLVLARDFLLHEEEPAPGVLGRYGFGYAFIKNPRTGVLAYGPGEFDAAVELINFHVLATGEVRVAMTFAANRPERIVNPALDPLQWGLRMADLASLGLAGRLLAQGGEALGRLTGGRDLDPVSAFILMANLLSGGRAAADLCISWEALEKSFLVTHFMQHYTMITGSILTWRQIRDWLDAASLPRWVVTGEGA
jgi:hypothetical protein